MFGGEMGKSLSEFANKKGSENPRVSETNEKIVKEKEIDEKKTKEKIDQFSKMSQNQLMSELFKEVGKQKQGGTFDFQNLANKIESIRPMLTEEQISNIDKLLKQIK